MQDNNQRFHFLPLILFFIFLLWQTSSLAFIPDTPTGNGLPLSLQPNDLLQFKQSNHVIGFAPDSIYAASGDHVLRIEFTGAGNILPEPAYAEGFETASSMRQVAYRNLWQGIDLVYEPAANGIVESTWSIAPGIDPGRIQMRYNSTVKIEENGSLRIDFASGWMQESSPIAWQDIEGKRHAVSVAFRKIDDNAIGFAIGDYDPDYPLKIDPTMQWNTFMGAYLWDVGYAIAVDTAGNIYVAGRSSQTWGTPINPHSGYNNIDGFVAKFNGAGILQWNTFMGSSVTTELFNTISVDGSGNILVGGYGSGNWGTPVQPYAGGDYDAVFAKLSPSGAPLWHTFLGSSGSDFGYAAVHNGTGSNIVVGGSSETWGAPLVAYTGGKEVFVAALDDDGTLQWSTFAGGNGDDTAVSLVLDSSGNIFLGGYSNGSWGTPILGYMGGQDAFVVKLNSSGVLQWNTFMGSIGDDYGNGIAVDRLGNIMLGGYSNATWGSPLRPFTGGNDVFVAQLDMNGSLLWHGFFGSEADDTGGRVAVDGDGNITVTGTSYATWGTPINAYAGGPDAFAAQLENNGTLRWNSFMGSATNNYDYGSNVGVDCAGNVFVVGTSDGGGWGTPSTPWINGTSNAFLARIGEPGHAVCTSVQMDQGSFTPTWQLIETDNTADVTINTEPGYIIDSVSGCGGTWTGINPYTTAPITTNCLITASFATVLPNVVMPVAGPPVSLTAAGANHSLALLSDGMVVGWGEQGAQTNPPAGLAAVLALAAGDNFSIALKQDGTVVGWGNGYWFGESPIPVGLSDVKAISAGGDHALALKTDGTVVGWGDNSVGQTRIPAGLSDVTAIAAATSGAHSLAVKEDGTVVAWGYNTNGQTNVPPGLTDVINVAGGFHFSLALKSDGTVVGWGTNYSGVLDIPPDLSGVTAIAAGGYHCLALKADGTLVAWGNNYEGQTDIPAELTGVVAISGGYTHSLAVQADGTVVAWGGENLYGQLTVPEGLNLQPFRGVHGTISPDMPLKAHAGTTVSLTVTPETGYTPSIGGSCGGTLVANVFTTDPVNGDCRVIASFNRLGDVDGNGRLDLSDVIVGLQNLTANPSSITPGLAADINADNKIGLAEIIYILGEMVTAP